MSSTWFITVMSNRARVTNVAVVERLLEKYLIRFADIEIETDHSGGGTLMIETSPDLGEWPAAVPVDQLPDTDDRDDDSRIELEDQLLDEKGEDGFLRFLLELAPSLASPLIIQAACFSSWGDFDRATEWRVTPNASQVEVKDIVAVDNKDDSPTLEILSQQRVK